MNTKLDLYTDLLNELNSRGISYEQEDKFQMVMVENGSDSWATVEVWNNSYTGGYARYTYSDNSTDFSNVGCPDFDNVQDAVDWVVR